MFCTNESKLWINNCVNAEFQLFPATFCLYSVLAVPAWALALLYLCITGFWYWYGPGIIHLKGQKTLTRKCNCWDCSSSHSVTGTEQYQGPANWIHHLSIGSQEAPCHSDLLKAVPARMNGCFRKSEHEAGIHAP